MVGGMGLVMGGEASEERTGRGMRRAEAIPYNEAFEIFVETGMMRK